MDSDLFPFKRSKLVPRGEKFSEADDWGSTLSVQRLRDSDGCSGQTMPCVTQVHTVTRPNTCAPPIRVSQTILFIVITYLKCTWIECDCNIKLSFLTTMLKSLDRVHKDSQWIVPWQMEVKLLSALGWRRSKNLGRILCSGFITHDLEFWSSRKKNKIPNWLQYTGVLL